MCGGGYSGGTPSDTPNSRNCDEIDFISTLNSPQPLILATLKVGAILDIEIWPDNPDVIVAKFGDVIAGSITGKDGRKLLNCLQNGYQYQGEVISLIGAICDVRITCT